MLSQYFYDITCRHVEACHLYRAKFFGQLWWLTKTRNI